MYGGRSKEHGGVELNRCLVCKVLSMELVNTELVRQHFSRIPQLIRGVNIELVGEISFLLEFSSMMNRKRVLRDGPWNLFKNLVISKEVGKARRDIDIQFFEVALWVQIHNVPLAYMNHESARFIGSNIGLVIEMDVGDNGECWGKYLWLRVLIHMNDPPK